MTRRRLLLAGAGAAVAASAPRSPAAQPAPSRPDVIVVGAGAFGAWTAKRLQEAGKRVLLLEAWAPAHARVGRQIADDPRVPAPTRSIPGWRWTRCRSGAACPGARACRSSTRLGVLFFFPQLEPYLEDTMRVHRRLSLPTELLDNAALRRRFRRSTSRASRRACEPGFGALMARRAVQTLVAEFVRAGGDYRQAAVLPPADGAALGELRTAAGETFAADRFVFACGPWLGRLFPALLGPHLPTRQEVFFFAPEPGDTRFTPGRLPGWADFNNGDIYYGMPDLEGRGFKIAHDAHGPGWTRTPAIAPPRPRRWRTCAPIWRAAFRLSPDGRSARRGSASMRTARTATC